MRATSWVVAGAALVCSCGSEVERLNVVVIVMDTARPDYLSVYGHPRPTTPFLEELAQSSTRYDRAYSTSCWTLPAHASLFSGESPEVHRTAQENTQFPAELPLLAEQLSELGYQTAAFSNNPWVSKTTGLDRGFETFVDRWRAAADAVPGTHATVAAISKWVEAERDAGRPSFVFVNLTEPHMPYVPPWKHAEEFAVSMPEWRRAIDEFFPRSSGASGAMIRHYGRANPFLDSDWPRMSSLYEGELHACDAVVGEIVRALDEVLDPEKTLLFVLSDHGENLGDHDHVNHVFNLYESNLRIALLARGPGFERKAAESRLVQITDLHPTILSAAGSDTVATSDALDLRRPLPTERVLRASLDWPKITLTVFPDSISAGGGPLDRYKRSLAAAVTPRWKMIRGSDGSVEVYDLSADPRETSPVDTADDSGRTFAALAAFLDRTDATIRAPGEAGGSGLPTDPATLDALRALGYTR